MLGPQSPAVFAVMMAVFAALIFTLVRVRQPVLKALAASAAFLPPMIFGVAIVNTYYDYYASWGDLWADMTDAAPAGAMSMTDIQQPSLLAHTLAEAQHSRHASHTGFLFSTPLTGTASHISRNGLIYLPPQYFRPDFARLRLPVVELLHGGPGTPTDYTRVLQVTRVYERLLAAGKARPAVLVMPDSNGGRNIALQCLNNVGGPLDETYLVQDVPDIVAARLRVQPPGPGWALSGYSEGGYCTANFALRHPGRYGVAGVLSGYFEPLPESRMPAHADPFRGNALLRAANTPSQRIRDLRFGAHLPRFWVMAGGASARDLADAQSFVIQVHRFQPAAPLVVVPGGGHDYQSWRKAEPLFLVWGTRALPPPTP